ncbi:acetyltransferase [Bacillus cihuensis]|nr:acetyltransferase [Bacillus cihuensis]
MMLVEADLTNFKLFDRSLRIINFAELEAKKTNKIVYPIHLLIGTSLERTGVCAELFINYPYLFDVLIERAKNMNFDFDEQGILFHPISMNISLTTKQVLENAYRRMKRFNQVYINEGILIKALLDLKDPATNSIIEGLDVSKILDIISSQRDMIDSLKNYTFPEIAPSEVIYRKAEQDDAAALELFVKKEFGNRWLAAIENGFQEEDIPIYVADENGMIVGFACFDVVRRKKDYLVQWVHPYQSVFMV